jgi:hypothetical protein
VNSVAFSTDGKRLASASDDKTVRLSDVDLKSWLKRACDIANRKLTREEWLKYLSDQPYHKTCPDLPGRDDAPQAATIQSSPARQAVKGGTITKPGIEPGTKRQSTDRGPATARLIGHNYGLGPEPQSPLALASPGRQNTPKLGASAD